MTTHQAESLSDCLPVTPMEAIRLPLPATQAEFFEYRDSKMEEGEGQGPQNINVLPVDFELIDLVLDRLLAKPAQTEEIITTSLPGEITIEEQNKSMEDAFFSAVFDESILPNMGLLGMLKKAGLEYEKVLGEDPADADYYSWLVDNHRELLINRYTEVARRYSLMAQSLTKGELALYKEFGDSTPHAGYDASVANERLDKLIFTIKDPIRFLHDWYEDEREAGPSAIYDPAMHEVVFDSSFAINAWLYSHSVRHEVNHSVSAASYMRVGDTVISKRTGFSTGYRYPSDAIQDAVAIDKNLQSPVDIGGVDNESWVEIFALRSVGLIDLDYKHTFGYLGFRVGKVGVCEAVKILAPQLVEEFETVDQTAFWQQPQTESYSSERWPALKRRNQILDQAFAPGFRNILDVMIQDKSLQDLLRVGIFKDFARKVLDHRKNNPGVALTSKQLAELLEVGLVGSVWSYD